MIKKISDLKRAPYTNKFKTGIVKTWMTIVSFTNMLQSLVHLNWRQYRARSRDLGPSLAFIPHIPIETS